MSSTPTDVVRQYFDLLRGGDLPGLANLFAQDVTWHQPGSNHLSGTYHGAEQLFAHLGRFMELSAGTFRIDQVNDIMANGDLIAATLQFSATAGGRTVSMTGVDIMRVVGGHIAEVWLFSADQTAEDALWDGARAAVS